MRKSELFKRISEFLNEGKSFAVVLLGIGGFQIDDIDTAHGKAPLGLNARFMSGVAA